MLDWLNEQLQFQNENGLRHDDFQRYRKFLDKKSLRQRKTLNLTYGSGKVFEGKTLNAKDQIRGEDGKLLGTAEGYLHYVLLESEKSWAFALESKQLGNVRHSQKRLKRACEHAKSALQLAADVYEAKEQVDGSKFEFPVEKFSSGILHVLYHFCFLDGSRLFEASEWKPALQRFTTCKSILVKLSTTAPSLAKTRLDQLVPFLRFCRYNLADEMQVEDNDADILTAQTILTLRAQQVAVTNLKLISLIEQINSSNDPETLLNLYSESCQLAHQDISSDSPETLIIHAYFAFEKAKSALLRDWALFLYMKKIDKDPKKDSIQFQPWGDEFKFEDVKQSNPLQQARVCDNLLQSVEEIKNLFLLKDDPGLQVDMKVYQHFFLALKCIHLASHHKSIGHVSECLELLDRAFNYLQEAKSNSTYAQMVDTATLKQAIGYPASLEVVEAFILGKKVNLQMNISNNPETPPKLCPLEPQLVPNKPIFFDLAYHYLTDVGSQDGTFSKPTEGKTLVGNLLTSFFGR